MRKADARNTDGLLAQVRLLETGPRLAGAVTGRLFGELGAEVIKVEPRNGDPARKRGPRLPGGGDGGIFLSQNITKRGLALCLEEYADRDHFDNLARGADVIISSWRPNEIKRQGLSPERLSALNPAAVLVYLTPFGLHGPRSWHKGPDLVVFHSSGLAKSLLGPVADPDSTPPVRAVGEQSEIVSGVAAACAAMFGLYRAERTQSGAIIDVSMQEALAFMDVPGLAAPSFGSEGRPRKLDKISGPGLTILPAADGFVAISPREEHQWKRLIGIMGDPEWGNDPRFADRTLREENSEAVHELLSEWSRRHNKMEIFQIAQDNRVPVFPLMNPAEHLESPQLEARQFFRHVESGGRMLSLPGIPYKTGTGNTDVSAYVEHDAEREGPIKWSPRPRDSTRIDTGPAGQSLPLSGIRVVDLSWVIAGPTCTRYLSAMGAEVIKVETSRRPDPGRAGQLHDVLGQSKLGITLNLKSPEGIDAIKRLISRSDIVVENFAPGVMDRLGLGWETLTKLRPDLIMVSASGTGQSGPTRHVAAYGTLLQVYTGFARLNGYPNRPPAIGMAWADPLCGLLLAYSAVAALRSRRLTNTGQRIDFSMVEAVLSTMPGPLLEYQMTGRESEPQGNADEIFFPHGSFHCSGYDSWVAVAVTNCAEWKALCAVIGAPAEALDWNVHQRRARGNEINRMIEEWTRAREPRAAADELQTAGVPAAASVASAELLHDEHLNQRGFFKVLADRTGVERQMPALPWQWNAGDPPSFGAAPGLGSDTATVLRNILGYEDEEIAAMEEAGALL